MLDAVPTQAWKEAGQVLHMLGALDADETITDRGRRLSELPLHPRLGAIVVTGVERGIGAMGCALAALIDERDVLRGRPVEVPADLGLRLDLLTDRNRGHALASGRSLQLVRARASDLARRIGCHDDGYDRDRIGLLVASGFPRSGRATPRGPAAAASGFATVLACGSLTSILWQARSTSSPSIWTASARMPSVRIGAGVDVTDLLETAGFRCRSHRTDPVGPRPQRHVVTRVDRHLGSLDLGSTSRRPIPSEQVVDLLLDHVKRSRLKALTWTDSSRALQARVEYVRSRQADKGWPDLSDKTLIATLDSWLGPLLVAATGRADLEVVSVAVALDMLLGRERRQLLESALPTTFALPAGRRLKIDYRAEPPTIKSRAQDFYGVKTHPAILNGSQPLTVELLSPAGRPIQRTADLPGFWDGSWAEVRKDMAGRYPKHAWPVDPRESQS